MFSTFKKRGLVYPFAIFFNKLVPASIFRFGIMDVYQLSNQTLEQPPTSGSAELLLLDDAAQRKALKSITRNELSETTTESHRAIAIRDKESRQLVGGLWVASGHFTETSLAFRLRFSATQRWVYCAFVEKDFRRKGLYSSCLSFTHSELSKLEPVELLVAFNPFNKASFKAHQKYLQTRLARIYSICFLGKAICFSSKGIEKSKLLGSRSNPVEFLCR